MVLSPDFTIVAVTDAYLALTMTERANVVGRPLFEVFPDNPDDPAADGVRKLRASLDRVLANKVPDRMAVQKYDIRRPASEGGAFEVRYWRPVNTPVFDDDGEVALILHDAEDVTKSMEQEASLLDAREANERLRLFIEHAPASLAMLDRDMRYLAISARWRADYALGDRDIIGRSHYEIFPEITEEWRAIHRRALGGEIIRTDENGDRFVRTDGKEQWVRWEVRPWKDTRGIVQGILIFSEDITEATRAGRETRRMERWLRVALSAAGAGAWQWDVATSENRWSDELWPLYGLEASSTKPSFEAWAHALLPEDRAAVVAEVQSAAAEHRDLSVEFRVRRPDGGVRHLLSRGQFVPNDGTSEGSYVGIVIDVTERKELEAKLREREREAALREQLARSEERYRDLLDAAPDAMVLVDSEGRIEMVNAQTERLFGYTREELHGAPLRVLVPEASRDQHDQHVETFFRQPVARPMGSNVELEGRRRDGTVFPIEVSLGPVRTTRGVAVSAAVRDISERRRLTAAAARMSQRLASAVESMDDAFILFDGDGRVVLCNGAYRRLLGVGDEAVLTGKTYEEILDLFIANLVFADDGAREAFREERSARPLEAQPPPFEARTRDGKNLRIMTQRTPEGGVLVTVWDLTEEERRKAELLAAHAAATAGSAAKTEFLSSMSHELRTPLNAVLGFAQLLERDKKQPLTERQQERVRRILTGGEQLLRLVDDVLDLARIEAGRVAISVEPVDVDEVINEVKRTLEPMQARQGIEIVLEPHAHVPLVAVDRMRFSQILTNFCSNALKYNRPHGSVTVAVGPGAPGRVRITVTDTGYGIPNAKQSLLFQPFQRAGQETGPIEGTGIGLVITRKLAALMNAEVGFESTEGRGSSFWVDVVEHAAMRRETMPPAVAPPRPLGSEEPAPRRRTILYVEDNPANVAFMQEVTALMSGVELLTATSGEAGLELALAKRPDLVILDVHLAGSMSGLDTARVLRASDARGIPIIGLSAAATQQDRKDALAAGFDGYLTKPVAVDDLLQTIDTHLTKHVAAPWP